MLYAKGNIVHVDFLFKAFGELIATVGTKADRCHPLHLIPPPISEPTTVLFLDPYLEEGLSNIRDGDVFRCSPPYQLSPQIVFLCNKLLW